LIGKGGGVDDLVAPFDMVRSQVETSDKEEGQWSLVVNRKKYKPRLNYEGGFLNIRGLNKPGRNLSLGQLIRNNHLDFIGIQETKKEDFLQS
jgi:hypothetical protein